VTVITDLSLSPAERYERGDITWNEYRESQALLDTFTSMEQRPKALTLAEARKLPEFQRRLADLSRTSSPRSSRPQGRQHAGPPAARSSSRSSRGSPDDDPSEPEPDPSCDQLLLRLRSSYEDAYRPIPAREDAWMARCPCAPDAGHTMLVLDHGEGVEPRVACRFNCPVPGIWRMLGFDTPAEIARRDRADVLAEEAIRYLAWLRRRSAS
jgi:hypothetical protein